MTPYWTGKLWALGSVGQQYLRPLSTKMIMGIIVNIRGKYSWKLTCYIHNDDQRYPNMKILMERSLV